MRKNIVIAFALFASYHLQAQKFASETFIGVNGGTTFSSVDFVPIVNQTKLMGYNSGVTVRYITESHFGLQAELNFSQRGWKETMTDPTQSYSRLLNYIELPFLTHVYFGSHNFRYFVNLGPKIAYLLSEKESGNYTLGANSEFGKAVEHPFDYSICGGSGFELRTKVGCFLIEGRYNFGLADIFYNSNADSFTRSSNQFISANLTYLVKL
ncbi:MAG: porin family protein [Bacteroidales bacterium]|nr:porin family protein [Bacteroidales bacterium]